MEKTKPLVLIVDDSRKNIDLLALRLKKEYQLGLAQNGQEALDYAEKQLPDLILLDVMMPEMDGFEVCTRLKAIPKTKDIPIIFLTAMSEKEDITQGFGLGAVDYITKPFQTEEVKARVRTHLSLKEMREKLNAQNIILEQKVKEKTSQLQEMLQSTLQTMAKTVETRDPYTAGHQQRVARFACAIAGKMGLSQDQIDAIRFAGILHDIGKIRTPVSILNRPGKLLEVEIKIIRIHPQVGYDILKDIPAPWPFAKFVLQHHERLDGSGYPNGLPDRDILQESKILTVADVTEALSSFRPYRPAPKIEAAIEEISMNRGKYYDPDAVDACIELIKNENFKFK